jgi:HSP20 family protein
MANLTRRDNIFDGLFDFRRDFDGIFNRLLTNTAPAAQQNQSTLFATVPAIEARVDPKDNQYHLRVALPGVEPSEVQINLQGNYLTISGEHKSEQEKKDSDYMHKEFSYEHFERTVMLPESVDTGKINADFNNGVLEITAPLAANALPRRIEVKSQSQVKTKGASA